MAWRQGPGDEREAIEGFISQLITLSRSEEACRILGVDGVLSDQVDITLLNDPLDYLAYDIAAAVRDAQEDAAPVQATMLSTLVAELRLCSLLIPHIDSYDLQQRVLNHLHEGLH